MRVAWVRPANLNPIIVNTTYHWGGCFWGGAPGVWRNSVGGNTENSRWRAFLADVFRVCFGDVTDSLDTRGVHRLSRGVFWGVYRRWL